MTIDNAIADAITPETAAIDVPTSPGAAAEARLAAVLDAPTPGTDTEGTAAETAPAGVPDGAPAADDVEALVPEDIGYKDAHKLRDEMRRTRERFAPFEGAFGELSEASRAALLDAAPALGDRLGATASVLAGMHPDDQSAFLQMGEALASGNVAQALAMFNQAAAALQQQLGVAPASPATQPGVTPEPSAAAVAPAAADGASASETLTRDQVEAMIAEREQAREAAALERRYLAEITTQAHDLGYDLATDPKTDPMGYVEARMLIELAAANGGDLAAADRTLKSRKEAAVAEYLDLKRAEAARTSGLADVGGSPSMGSRAPLATMDDAAAAAEARLNAVLGA